MALVVAERPRGWDDDGRRYDPAPWVILTYTSSEHRPEQGPRFARRGDALDERARRRREASAG